eukprot:Sspe_Gene.4338::Locus_1428_Transcript_1_1_Confidence_1.000_Length_1675::g.4338::m.4338
MEGQGSLRVVLAHHTDEGAAGWATIIPHLDVYGLRHDVNPVLPKEGLDLLRSAAEGKSADPDDEAGRGVESLSHSCHFAHLSGVGGEELDVSVAEVRVVAFLDCPNSLLFVGETDVCLTLCLPHLVEHHHHLENAVPGEEAADLGFVSRPGQTTHTDAPARACEGGLVVRFSAPSGGGSSRARHQLGLLLRLLLGSLLVGLPVRVPRDGMAEPVPSLDEVLKDLCHAATRLQPGEHRSLQPESVHAGREVVTGHTGLGLRDLFTDVKVLPPVSCKSSVGGGGGLPQADLQGPRAVGHNCPALSGLCEIAVDVAVELGESLLQIGVGVQFDGALVESGTAACIHQHLRELLDGHCGVVGEGGGLSAVGLEVKDHKVGILGHGGGGGGGGG